MISITIRQTDNPVAQITYTAYTPQDAVRIVAHHFDIILQDEGKKNEKKKKQIANTNS